jgi:hypothetical protein
MDYPIQVLRDKHAQLRIVALSADGEHRAQYLRMMAEVDAAIVVLEVHQFNEQIASL